MSSHYNHWAPAAPPKTKLGRYRKLSPKAGVHLSPIALGAMSIGDKWDKAGMGSMNKEQSFKLLDAYYDAGGNFIDTSSNYQDESSEKFIGEWMEKRGNRNQVFVATKYTTNYKLGEGPEFGPQCMFNGNSVKCMHVTVEESLRKLRTNYIDLLYLHWWDYETSIEEVVNGLHTLVQQGKVLYLGVSDTPAWVVSAANMYARQTGKTPFVIYQGAWSVLLRDFEREIIPMAREQGMALAPWNVLHGGKIRSDAEEERRRKTGEGGRTLSGPNWERSEDEKKMCRALEKVAKEVGAKNIGSVAIAYVMQKTPYVFPLVGGRKVEHLMSNLEALDIVLTPEHIAYIESILPFDRGFPYSFFGSEDSDFNYLFKTSGNYDRWPLAQAIRPTKN